MQKPNTPIDEWTEKYQIAASATAEEMWEELHKVKKEENLLGGGEKKILKI